MKTENDLYKRIEEKNNILCKDLYKQLIDGKMQRASIHHQAHQKLKDTTKFSQKSIQYQSVDRKRGPVLHSKQAQTGGDQDGIPFVGGKIRSY